MSNTGSDPATGSGQQPQTYKVRNLQIEMKVCLHIVFRKLEEN
jgi:hypothetical protein